MAIDTKLEMDKIGQSSKGSGLYLNDLKNIDELKFQVLSTVKVGYQYFQDIEGENGVLSTKPCRSELYPETITNPSKNPWDSNYSAPKQFMIMAIYDFSDDTVKLWNVSKRTLIKALMDIELDEDLGEIQDYMFKAKKTGVKMDTEYSLIRLDKVEPTEDMKKSYKEAEVDLEGYMKGDGGIGSKKDEEKKEYPDDVNPEDIPF